MTRSRFLRYGRRTAFAVIPFGAVVGCGGSDPAGLAHRVGALTASTIAVRTTAQKVSSDGECSLEEAIYAANFDTNEATSPSATDLTSYIVMNCPPGSGDDTIARGGGGVSDEQRRQ